MTLKTKQQPPYGEITIFHNNTLTNDPCYLCGKRTDPDGLDYGINQNLVCVECVRKNRPELVKILEEVRSFIDMEVSYAERTIYDRVQKVFNETIEERVLRTIKPEEEIPF